LSEEHKGNSNTNNVSPINLKDINNLEGNHEIENIKDISHLKNNSNLMNSNRSEDNSHSNNECIIGSPNTNDVKRRKSDFTFLTKSGKASVKIEDFRRAKTIYTAGSKRLEIGFSLFAKRLCCFNKLKENEKHKLEDYEFCSNYIEERLDITYYIRLVEQFQVLKILFLNYYQNRSLDFMKKFNLKNKTDIEYIKEIHKISDNDNQLEKEIADYYIFQTKSCNLDKFDEIIYDYVNKSIKQSVSNEIK